MRHTAARLRRSAATAQERALRAYRALRTPAARCARYVLRLLGPYGQPLRRRWRAATPQQRHTTAVAAGAAALGFVVAVVAVAVAGPWDGGQRAAERSLAAGDGHDGAPPGGSGAGRGTGPGAAPEVLTALGGGGHRAPGSAHAAPAPSPSVLARTLKPLMADGALGSVRTGAVLDAATGRQLYAARARTPITPASTVKLATATAALSARGADHRIATRAVRTGGTSGGGRVVLVGGGDPTLSRAALDTLAADTARALRGHGTRRIALGYDTSRFTGPVRHRIGPNDNLAPVAPLMVDEARAGHPGPDAHGPAPRAQDPAREAADAFGAALARHGVDVQGTPKHTKAPARAHELAVHHSAPLSALVERMLTYSDNDIAEALARQTALATGEPASFRGGAAAVRKRLHALGLPLARTRFADGSGLDRRDKVTAALLTRLLLRVADPDRPQLRPVLTGLPVAHFTGSLDARYGADAERGGAGLVRAKTGTLTGVNTLAGTVVDGDGRLLVFAFMTSGTTDPSAAQDALDRMAAALAGCGCRSAG